MIYLLSIACSNLECYRSLNSITDEMTDCLLFLYIGAIFFFVLAIYLHEIIPQDPEENGLTKSPLFFLKWLLFLVMNRRLHLVLLTLKSRRNEKYDLHLATKKKFSGLRSTKKFHNFFSKTQKFWRFTP